MDCERIRREELMASYLSHGLEEALSDELETHILGCPGGFAGRSGRESGKHPKSSNEAEGSPILVADGGCKCGRDSDYQFWRAAVAQSR